jgi:hypothetical protein
MEEDNNEEKMNLLKSEFERFEKLNWGNKKKGGITYK